MTARSDWYPQGAHHHGGPPPVGRLLARDHAVWRVVKVTDLELSDADRDVWLDVGMPDVAEWRGRPYRVGVQFVGGARPSWAPADGAAFAGHLNLPAVRFGESWYLYPDSGRWPMCSCCREPMPCRAELQDREIATGLAKVEELAQRLPGCCWGCGEPITSRQKAVAYLGDNLDLPGGPGVRFHTRAKDGCLGAARKYELRWIALDPRRERILTWPRCGGILVVHADGSSECRSARGALGQHRDGEPDCRGHLTHDHGSQAACYVGDAWFEPVDKMDGCPRGCQRERHPGIRTTPRPARRPSTLEDQLPVAPSA